MKGNLVPVAVACSVLALGMNADVGKQAYAATLMATPQYHAVPCPSATAQVIRVKWQIQAAGIVRQRRGARVIGNPTVGRDLYRQICSVPLIAYNHPVATACPAAHSESMYHLAFARGTRVLLRVTEQDAGCSFLWIDGHHNLGIAFGALYLPPGIPQSP